ncbi:methyl-accepting chemotaxis protein [Sphingomonas yunnanensis]|uniref:methyl-accepting chemotaxis protein n=1 Tax=Sphingomonas yunnanensis TaxID=310400 RepID=UPI001CA6532E|nr:methyl-accepting chemotaxis protein [Sphingomonas yunnanensis]MBY9062146.1 methyl-accepting chemotaxis protein [Sphingomonas yunnanensis]
MFHWFKASAPIRAKFTALLVVYTALVAAPVATTVLSTTDPLRLGLAVAALAAVVIVTLGARKLVCDPYVDTVVRMEGLAQGDFTSAIRHTEHRDCVGRMTKAMDVFRRNGVALAEAAAAQRVVVTSLGAGLQRLAANDLTYRIETAFYADYDRLRLDYNRAVEAMSDVLGAVTAASQGIDNGAADIRSASDELSQRTEQQAASLEETAAAMEQITSTVRETAEGADRAHRAVTGAREEAEQSGGVVRRAVDAMGGIERASNEISEIISVIDGIAFQTNLLALNAGVEAARAGDAGKGFAVVASEVRALAQRSADAARDVKAKITASTEQVDAGVGLVSATGSALERIIARIGEISTLVATIANSAKHQATGLQQINTAVSEMDGVTQQNAAMVEEATAAARSLADEATQVAAQVARFRLSSALPATALVPAPSPVHELQARAASAGREIARGARQRSVTGTSGTALAVAQDDWSEF